MVNCEDKLYKDIDWLYWNYWGLGYSMPKMAKFFGCDRTTIRNWMEKYSIERRRKGSHRPHLYDVHKRIKGKTFEEIFGPKQAKIERQKRVYAGLMSAKAMRENRPFWFMGVPFGSKQEMLFAKLLFEKLEIIPIEGINTHVNIGKEIDFYFYGMFIEYHPMDTIADNRKDRNLYFQERRSFLDKNGYSKYPLIHLVSLKEVEMLVNFLYKFLG